MARPRRFTLELRLDPPEDYREQLRRWPASPLTPDYIVVTSGWVEMRFDGVPVAYANGKLVHLRPGEPLPAGATPEIADYLGGFAQRLADALVTATNGQPRFVGFVDNPGGLWFHQRGERTAVAYREGGAAPDLYRVVVPTTAFRGAARDALSGFHKALLTINPNLERQEDVALLRNTLRRL